jgi:hypothetical protein
MKIFLGKSNLADRAIVGRLRKKLIQSLNEVYEWDPEEGGNTHVFTSDLYIFVPASKLKPSDTVVVIGKGLYVEIKNAAHKYALYYIDEETDEFYFSPIDVPYIIDENNWKEYAEVALVGEDKSLTQLLNNE